MIHHHNFALKPREARRKVRIPVRMRAGRGWADTCMLDVSSRGLSMQGDVAPPQGSYIEVRRGSHVIVARVVWTEDRRFGACTQDPIAVDALVSGSETPGTSTGKDSAPTAAERRAEPRALTPVEMHHKSRMAGRSLEFAFFLVAIGSSAVLGEGLVREFFARPIVAVSAALR